MDGQRFDRLTGEVARATSRRRMLRLAGGGLGAAVLAALGRGSRTRAEQGSPVYFSNCQEEPDVNVVEPGELVVIAKPCGQCREGQLCVALVNPANQLVCRCIDL
jgi:hypothetical protein